MPLRARALEEYHRRRRASTSVNASFAVCVQSATLRFRARAMWPRQAEAASLKGLKAELRDPDVRAALTVLARSACNDALFEMNALQ